MKSSFLIEMNKEADEWNYITITYLVIGVQYKNTDDVQLAHLFFTGTQAKQRKNLKSQILPVH